MKKKKNIKHHFLLSISVTKNINEFHAQSNYDTTQPH